MKIFLILFGIGFTTLSTAFSVLYYGLKWSNALGTLYRMHTYHLEYPFQYIGLVSLVFGTVGHSWIHWYGSLRGALRGWSITLALFATILISSPIGGILWQIHDMQHGYIPENAEIYRKITQGVSWGIETGWLIVLLSFPLNLIGFTVGFISLDRLGKFSRKSFKDFDRPNR